MTGSTVLDVVLALVLLAYAWSGWRQGFVAAVLGLVGLLAGAVAAVKVAPGLIDGRGGIDLGTPAGTLLLIGIVLVAATLGQWLMLLLASRVRTVIGMAGLRLVDNLLGAVAVLVASVLVVWVVAGAARVSGPVGLRNAIASSTVVRTVDAVVPRSAQTLVDDLTEALDRGGFPRVFEGLGPEPIASVQAPDRALVEDAAVSRALRSVIHVRASSPRCGQTQVGSGWVLSPGVVVTNAHVVAGARTVRLSVRGTGPEVTGRVVRFDPDRDVAVVVTSKLDAPALTRGDALGRGDDAVLAGFPGDDGLWVGPARVRSVLEAKGGDIYGGDGTVRQIYSLRAEVRRGASGGPMVDPEGHVVGMVFATSLDDPQTGYAMTYSELAPVVRGSSVGDPTVSTGQCRGAA